MINYITGKFKKGFSIMEILVVVGLVAALAVYAGLEMSRKDGEREAGRMAAHISYITSALQAYHTANGSFPGGLTAIQTLCDQNHLMTAICDKNVGGSDPDGFSGITTQPTYALAGGAGADINITVMIESQPLANALKTTLTSSQPHGIGTVTGPVQGGVGAETEYTITIPFTAGEA